MEEEFDEFAPGRSPSVDDYIPKPVNTIALSAFLMDSLVRQKWFVKKKKESKTYYFVTRKGWEKLQSMGIDVYRIF